MKRRTATGLVVLFVLLLVIGYMAAVDRSPPHTMIDNAYFHCDKCRSLQGGVWGKGPTKFFNGSNRRFCVHRWKEITRGEFKQLAAAEYGADWGTEIPFWRDE